MGTYDANTDGWEAFDWVEGVEFRSDDETDMFMYRVAGTVEFSVEDVEATYRSDREAGLPRPRHRDVLLRTAAKVSRRQWGREL
jgi:hypothetical protein